MEYSWYEKEEINKMNDYKVINGNGRYWNEDSGKWVGNKIKYEIDEKYIRYEFSVYDDRQIKRDFEYSLVDRIGKFLFLIYKKCIEIKRRMYEGKLKKWREGERKKAFFVLKKLLRKEVKLTENRS